MKPCKILRLIPLMQLKTDWQDRFAKWCQPLSISYEFSSSRCLLQASALGLSDPRQPPLSSSSYHKHLERGMRKYFFFLKEVGGRRRAETLSISLSKSPSPSGVCTCLVCAANLTAPGGGTWTSIAHVTISQCTKLWCTPAHLLLHLHKPIWLSLEEREELPTS